MLTPVFVVLQVCLVSLSGIAINLATSKPSERVTLPGPLRLISDHPWLAVGILTAAAAWLAWWQWHRSKADTAQPRSGVDPRNRARLLAHARTRADGQLTQALHHVVPLELGLRTRPDVVDFPTELLIRRAGEMTGHPVPAGQSLDATFDALDQAMLILGAPGSGKTVLLNQLATALADRAERDPTQPIPVVLNLASWAARRPPLDAWLADELSVVYGVSRKLGANLIIAGMLLPLLDGLDEVPADNRAACVQAINDYQAARAEAERRLVPLVVCSRRAEAEALATQLRLAGAILIESPTDQQVTSYLQAVGATDVLAVMQADPELSEWLRSPLTLSVVALASDAAKALREPPERRMAALLDAYVTTMLTPPGHGGRRRPALQQWNPDQIRGWLAWLARSMTAHDLSEFYLERLQPTWLRAAVAQRAVRTAPAIVGLLVGVLAGVLGTVIGGSWVGGPFGVLQRVLGVGPTNILVGAVVGWWAGGAGGRKQIEAVETFQWSSGNALGGALGGGLLGGLSSALAFGLVGALGGGLGGALVGGLLGGLLGGLVGGLVGALSGFEGAVSRTALQPNEGIHRSARYGLLLGVLVGVTIGVLVGVLAGVLPPELGGGQRPMIILVAGVTASAFGFALGGGGAVVQHYTLRLLLIRSKATPRRYVRFLQAAVDGLLLRRIGGGYRFPHRLLQERLVTYPPATPTASMLMQPSEPPREAMEAP
jgi:hypothetical protein